MRKIFVCLGEGKGGEDLERKKLCFCGEEEKQRRKRKKTLGEGQYILVGGEEKPRRKRRKIFGEDLSRMLRSLGFGLETFANF